MNRDDIVGLVLFIIAIIVVVGVGYIVLRAQVVAVREYCESLIANGTISNFSDCNITLQAN